MASLNFVDIIILVIFALSIIIGFGRGFVSEVISLIALIAAFAVAIYFTTPLATYFTSISSVQHVMTQSSDAMGVSTTQPVSYVALAISFTLLFVGTILIGVIIKALLNIVLTAGGVGIGNRIMGGIFGVFRGFLINLVIIFLIQLSPLTSQDWWQQSKYVPQFQPAVDWLGKVISPTLANLKSKLDSTIIMPSAPETNTKTTPSMSKLPPSNGSNNSNNSENTGKKNTGR